jgi:hypothetical protein
MFGLREKFWYAPRSLNRLSRFLTLALVPFKFSLSENLNGAEEDRTPDPLLAKQVLSQLSYSPLI